MKSIASIFALVAGVAFAAGPTHHKITPKKAGQIAIARVHGTIAKTPKLEHEDGQWQYEVLVKSRKKLVEVNVNADSGKISSIENTSAAEEAKEAKHEG